MLPFLKDRHEGAMSGPIDVKIRQSDAPPEEFGMLDAIAEDLIEAIGKKDKKLLKSTLEAFCEHIQDLDQIQDNQES